MRTFDTRSSTVGPGLHDLSNQEVIIVVSKLNTLTPAESIELMAGQRQLRHLVMPRAAVLRLQL